MICESGSETQQEGHPTRQTEHNGPTGSKLSRRRLGKAFCPEIRPAPTEKGQEDVRHALNPLNLDRLLHDLHRSLTSTVPTVSHQQRRTGCRNAGRRFDMGDCHYVVAHIPGIPYLAAGRSRRNDRPRGRSGLEASVGQQGSVSES